ncbi:MAG TPA: glycosyltransferase family 4 protein [Firmicutes bacterium]|nr:glycosyltransferase family 4 protein [Bacillota bacterium]
MKRIIFFSRLSLWSMDNNKGAPSFQKTVQGYADAGWEVILVTPTMPYDVSHSLGNVRHETYSVPFSFATTEIRKIGYFFKLFNTWASYSAMKKIGKKYLNSNTDTVLYAYEIGAVKPVKQLSRRYKLPWVTRFQGTILSDTAYTLFNRIRYYPHFYALHQSADITIMTDDGTLGDKVLERAGNHSKQIFFWKNGVDIAKTQATTDEILSLRKQYGLRQDEPVLLTVSRLASWKRVDRAIRALAQVIQAKADCKLIIVGDGDSRPDLEKLVQSLSLEKSVYFAGAVDHDDIYKYLGMADIFLSLYDLSNVGNPLLEAMCCAKPIITLNVGDTSSLIKHEQNGILLDPKDENKISESILRLLNDPSFAAALGNAAKEYADSHFWDWDTRIATEVDIVGNML